MEEDREKLDEIFREEAVAACISIGLTEDEAEREVEDYMDSDFY